RTQNCDWRPTRGSPSPAARNSVVTTATSPPKVVTTVFCRVRGGGGPAATRNAAISSWPCWRSAAPERTPSRASQKYPFSVVTSLSTSAASYASKAVRTSSTTSGRFTSGVTTPKPSGGRRRVDASPGSHGGALVLGVEEVAELAEHVAEASGDVNLV